MGFLRRAPATNAHSGTAPAAAMVTPFALPCGRDFYDFSFRRPHPYFRKECAPPNFNEYWWSSVGYYSPAVCPSGYTVGCTRWEDEQGPTVEATETAMMCVPSGYTCADNPSVAESASAKAVMIQIRWADSDLPSLATHPLIPGAAPSDVPLGLQLPIELREPHLTDYRQAAARRAQTAASAETTLAPATAPVLDLRQFGRIGDPTSFDQSFTEQSFTEQSSTEQSFTSQSSGGGGESTPTTSGNSMTTGPSETTDASGGGGDNGSGNDNGGSSSGGLSSGAKAGIGIGITLGLILVLGLVAFFVWRYRKGRVRRGPSPPPAPVLPELHGAQVGPGRAELGGGPEKHPFAAGGGAFGGKVDGVSPPQAVLLRPELDAVRSESYPSELSSQPRMFEVDAAPRPTPELSPYQYGYSQNNSQQYQGQAQYAHPGGGAQYDPYAQQPGMQAVPTHIAYTDPQSHSPATTAVETVSPGPHGYGPAEPPLLHFQHQQEQQHPPQQVNRDQQPQQHPPMTWQHPPQPEPPTPAPGQSSPSAPAPAAQASQAEPSAADLSQLMEEHARLETQRQTLLQLQQIEQQQAALRDRISAAQQGRSQNSPDGRGG